MSEAQVQFLDIEGEPCKPNEKPARFTFRCVRWNQGRDPRLHANTCGELLIAEGPHSIPHGIPRNGQGENGGKPQWDWDGNKLRPTFAPSINCEKVCGWHGYLRNGRCVDVQGRDEPT